MRGSQGVDMNPRIRELAEQDEFSEKDLHIQGDNFQMFAELILKDVFNRFGDEILSLHYLEQGCCQDSVHLLKSKIQEHFGVEE
jgi:hypothetical protein